MPVHAIPPHFPPVTLPESTPPAARPWLARLHPALFTVCLGLLGLSGAWGRLVGLSGVGGPDGIAAAVGTGLLGLALALLAVLLTLWAVKAVRHGDVLRQELGHPVVGALLSLAPLCCLMAVALLGGRWPQGRGGLLALAAVALVGQGLIAWRTVMNLTNGKTPAELVTPALYLPTVAGGFLGALALAACGLHGGAVVLFGLGLGAWALVELRVLNRLFAAPLPLALRTTLGIEMAPAAVGTLVVVTLWPDLPVDVMLLLLGATCAPALAVLARWRAWTEVPFNAGFWSFSFPVAAFAGAVVETVRAGGWPIQVAQLAAGLASAVIGFLLVKTVTLTVRGKLLPPV